MIDTFAGIPLSMAMSARYTAYATALRSLAYRLGRADSIDIAVHNEGPPIPAEQMDTIFSRFIRAAADDGHHRGHLGLGLFIAREIAIAHGGSLPVKSDAENATTFTATTPRQAAPSP